MTMVPIPYRIYPASCNMNCSPRIHFIIPSLGLDRKLPLYLSITVPIAVATTQGEERPAMEKTRPVKPQKFLSAQLITNSTCDPELELGDNRIPTIVKTELRENSSHQMCLLGIQLTGQSQLLRAAQTCCPLFILMTLLATLNLVLSKSPKNYHSANPSKVA